MKVLLPALNIGMNKLWKPNIHNHATLRQRRLTSDHQLGRSCGAVHHRLSRAGVQARLAELSVDDQQVANVLLLQEERRGSVSGATAAAERE